MRQRIKNIIKYVVQKKYRQKIDNRLKTTAYQNEGGNYEPGKRKVLIVQRLNDIVGTFSDYIVFLHYIERAAERNMIAIIDRQTNKNYFLQAPPDVNTWEIFFEQPMDLSIKDVDFDNMAVQRCFASDLCSVSLLRCDNEAAINYWRGVALKYIRFNQNTLQHLLEWKTKILSDKRVLGVSVREGYELWFSGKAGIGKGHALQASLEQVINDVIEYLEQWNCQYVFVTCQKEETLQQFKDVFSDKVLFYPRERKMIDGLAAHSVRNFDEEKRNELDYISEIYLLSNCTSFLCSENSGSEAAFIMSSGYEHFYCYDCGLN